MPADDTTVSKSTEADRNISEHVNELSGMIISYVTQETVDPIKSVGRYLGFGFAGAIMISIGWAVLSVATVRLIQAETAPHLEGNLSWVPYIGGLLVAAGGAAWAASRIVKEDS